MDKAVIRCRDGQRCSEHGKNYWRKGDNNYFLGFKNYGDHKLPWKRRNNQ